jgi:protoporphyrinogen oxidase
VLTRTPVRAVASQNGRALGVVTEAGLRRHGHVLTTMLQPAVEQLVAPDLAALLPQDPARYLGVVCVVARTRRSVSPYYALNITDRSVPLTSVVETTHVVDPEQVGSHLLYVPRYVNPDHADLDRPSGEIVERYLGHVRTMFPGFDPGRDVVATQVARARRAEPVHRAGRHRRGMVTFPAPGLATASSADIYPGIVNGQEIIGVAERVVEGLLARLGAAAPERMAA